MNCNIIIYYFDIIIFKEKLYYRLKYDSPLWIAIESSLKNMRSDCQKQFDELNCNSKEEIKTPIKKPWWKIWKK